MEYYQKIKTNYYEQHGRFVYILFWEKEAEHKVEHKPWFYY